MFNSLEIRTIDSMPTQPRVLRRITASVLLVLNFCLAPTTMASFPVIYRSHPLGVVRGEEATLTFYGERLGDAHFALADLPGIEILDVKSVDAKSATVKLKTFPGLANGLYPIRIVTHSGISNVRLIGVGTMPIVQEVEPNGDFEKPQVVALNSTVEGIVTREDMDYFQVELAEGQQITAEIEAIRLMYTIKNRNIFDPYIAILDEDRFEVASSDDSSLLSQDGVFTFTASKSGKYRMVVRDSSFGGSPLAGYRLHVGTFPRPVAVIPGGGQPGEMLSVTWISIDGSRKETKVLLPTDPMDQFGIFDSTADDRSSPSPNWVRVNELPVQMEQEPNNNHREAPDFKVPAAFCGVLDSDGDFDNFGFDCVKNEKFRVQVFARELLRSPTDAVINVFGPDGKTIVSSDDIGRRRDPYVEFTAKVDGKHTIRIYDHLRGGSDLHHYRIEVERAHPKMELELKEIRRDESSVASIPVGGQTAIMAQVKRKDYNGPIELSVEGLPEGITATTFPIPAGRPEIPVLLSADSTLDPIAGFFRLVGKSDQKNPNAKSQFRQVHKLVLGQNRRDLWKFTTSHSAFAVCKKAPFQIEVVQPKTPLVRQGSKNIRVKIVRDEGFDGAVRIRTIYNPPGIGINNSRSIAKDRNEVEIPVTANGRAVIGKWPLIFLANFPQANGNADIATPAITLDVRDLYFKYEFPKVAAEQGTEATIPVTLSVSRPYEGEAEIQLVGLPNGVTSPAATQMITAETTTVNFPVVVANDAKPGKHKTLVCTARIKVGDETIVQTTGTGEIRIDKPLPPKKGGPMPKMEARKTDSKKPVTSKPPSRLEPLRKMKE